MAFLTPDYTLKGQADRTMESKPKKDKGQKLNTLCQKKIRTVIRNERNSKLI